jgi:hypothetical protein
MKKIILGLLVASFAIQSYANTEYRCLDASTGLDGGKFTSTGLPADANGNGSIFYSYSSASSEGWLLTITEDGKLYNADDMVRHGKDFHVGEIKYENFQLIATINGRKLYCE